MSNNELLTDEELIHLLKKDDKAAFSTIYSRYAEPLAGFAASKLHAIDDARDILHDLFVTLWENRRSIIITTNLRAYLFASIRYKIVDCIRRNITREVYRNSLQSLAEPMADDIEKFSEVKELQTIIGKSLEQLPGKTREIYKMSREQFLSIQEIAKILSLSEQTVKNQLTIALKHLRQTISGISMFVVLFDLFKK